MVIYCATKQKNIEKQFKGNKSEVKTNFLVKHFFIELVSLSNDAILLTFQQ